MRTRDRINREFKMENWIFMKLEVISRAVRRLRNDVMLGEVKGTGDWEKGQHHLQRAFCLMSWVECFRFLKKGSQNE